ncbi:lumican-like [Brienomyrus brachyistius]|uniref:lumican-like n=1 Tax=Brienomyrus brachyistius TaxID=42636 RepID=UPI0020B2E577|nr:lumican-like [Brienomyrus brachyistius]
MGCLWVTLAVTLLSTTICQDYEYRFYGESEPDYDRYTETQPEYDRSPQHQVDYSRLAEIDPDYDRSPQHQVDFRRLAEIDSDYDRSPQHQVDFRRVAEMHPDYDRSSQHQVDYRHLAEIEPDYDRSPQHQVDFRRVAEMHPDYDRSPQHQVDVRRLAEIDPDYDHSPQYQVDFRRVAEMHPDYDRSSQYQVDYSRLPELHPDYDRYIEPQPEYNSYGQHQPYYESYAHQQLDYDSYVQPSNPVIPQCALECDCPIDFPSAMYCDDRNLHFIPLVPSGIKYLYLQNNVIQEVKANVFDNATDLLWLILDHNHITSENIEKGSFDKLDNLQKLFFSYNNLTEPVEPLAKSLNELRMIGNKLSKIPLATLSGLENLTALYLQGNQLTFESIDGAFIGLKSLVYLDISDNKLNNLPSSLPTSLETLYADQNNINSIPTGYVQELLSLQYLRISHNQLVDTGIPVDTFNVSSLIELDLSYNKLHTIPEVNEKLENLYLQVNRINRFDLSSFCQFPGASSRLTYLRLDGNNISQSSLPKEISTCLRRVTMLLID